MIFFAAFVIALLVALAFSSGFRRNGATAALVVFFFILFLAGLSAGYWIMPFGPVWGGVSWLPIISIILIVALLLAIPPPSHRAYRKGEHKISAGGEDITAADAKDAAAVSMFAWIALVIFAVLAVSGFFSNGYGRSVRQ